MRTPAFRVHANAGLRIKVGASGCPLPRLPTPTLMKRFRFICLPRRPSASPRAHVVGACSQPSGPRPRVSPGAGTPPGAHGAWMSTGTATQGAPPVSSPRLRKPASRSCSASAGSATGGAPCVAYCNVICFAPCAPGVVPALRGLNAGARAAGLLRYLG